MGTIDGWMNVRVAGHGWQKQVAAELFKRSPDDIFRKYTVEEVLALMDAAGVEKGILGVNTEMPERDVLAFASQHPSRFALAAHFDPRRGMKAVRALASLCKGEPVVSVRALPCLYDLPPSDRAWYPMFGKAVELSLPVTITTGIPGPPLPGRCQDPIHLDDVCLFFPELTIVMANGADPWWSVAIRLMAKYPRLHMMTSAYSPRHLPEELIRFMNGRGREKIIFGTDFPFLPLDRCVAEAKALDLREGVLDHYLHANAARVFFGAAAPAEAGPS
jgi:uncharacterized protein